MKLNQTAIFERLAATKKYGLVRDYLVSWSAGGRRSAKITVWGNGGTPDEVVRDYVARLLRGLVSDREIRVATDR